MLAAPPGPLALETLFFFLAMLGLHCFGQAFSSYCEQGPLFIAVSRFLIAAASIDAEHWL